MDLEPWFLNLVNQDDLIDTICISFAVSKQILETWFVSVSRGMNQPFTPINNAYMYNLSEVKLKFLSNKNDQLKAFLDTKSFSETTKFIWDLCETRNFNCTAAEALGVEVTGANFKTSACLFNFTCRIIFAHARAPHALSFCFKSAEWAGNFVVCSFEVWHRSYCHKKHKF